MKREQIKQIRVGLLLVWTVVLATLLLGGCTTGMLDEDDDHEPDTATKYPISFAPLQVAGEVETRADAASTPFSGTMRLLVYANGAEPSSAEPVANYTFAVKDGTPVQTAGEEPLSLYAGTFQFYALSPSTIDYPSQGSAKGTAPVASGVDLLASLTSYTVDADHRSVTLAPLLHKASKVSFTVSKASGATFSNLTAVNSLALFSQPVSPATFTLGAAGGSLSATAGSNTVELKPFAKEPAGSETYYAERVLLPKPSGAFKILLKATLTVNGVNGEYNLIATAPAIKFEPGMHYKYKVSVKDPREMVAVTFSVTPWNTINWGDKPFDGDMGITPFDPDEEDTTIDFKETE